MLKNKCSIKCTIFNTYVIPFIQVSVLNSLEILHQVGFFSCSALLLSSPTRMKKKCPPTRPVQPGVKRYFGPTRTKIKQKRNECDWM